MANKKNIAVVGLGVTGCQTAAFFAAAGHQVTVFDKRTEKLDKVQRGECPVFEAQVCASFQQGAKAGKIRTAEKLALAIRGVDTVFLSPGLADEFTSQVSYAAIKRLAGEVAEQWATTPSIPKLSIVIRHPLFLGGVAELFASAIAANPSLIVVLNPALYRQSRALTDTQNSPLHIVASADRAAAREVANLYQGAGIKCDVVPESVGEMLPAVCGSFHALKIAFTNEVAALATSQSVPADLLLNLLAKDTLLNASGAYLKPGNGYSGLNLPRSVGQLTELSGRAKMKAPILEHLNASNEAHFERLRKQVRQSKANRVGLFGLSYRPDTDDTRGSMPIRFVDSLLADGKQVRIFDPQIQMGRLDQPNWFSLLSQLPLAERLLTPNFEELVGWSEDLILLHPPTKSQSQLIQSKPVVVFNWSGSALEPQEA